MSRTVFKYRIKKTSEGYMPQWYAGWFRWKPFKLMYADTCICGTSIYSEWHRDPVFTSKHDAESFLKKAVAEGHYGVYHKGYDECLPGLIS